MYQFAASHYMYMIFTDIFEKRCYTVSTLLPPFVLVGAITIQFFYFNLSIVEVKGSHDSKEFCFYFKLYTGQHFSHIFIKRFAYLTIASG